MIKKLKLASIAIGLMIFAATSHANGVPIVIFTEYGECHIFGENEFHYLYQCEDGSVLFIRKGSQGNGGGGGGGNDSPIDG